MDQESAPTPTEPVPTATTEPTPVSETAQDPAFTPLHPDIVDPETGLNGGYDPGVKEIPLTQEPTQDTPATAPLHPDIVNPDTGLNGGQAPNGVEVLTADAPATADAAATRLTEESAPVSSQQTQAEVGVPPQLPATGNEIPVRIGVVGAGLIMAGKFLHRFRHRH
jgi:hypothetical protein